MGPRVPESNGSSVASGACSIEDNDLEGAEKGNVNAKHDGNSRMPNQASIPAGFLESLKATPATKNPKATLQAVYAAGEYKAGLPMDILMVQSFMAGIYIAIAGHMFLVAGGGILGASLFPAGLLAVVLTSGELFTGDALVFVAAVLGGRVSFKYLVRNWTVSWICNFAGCLAWAYFMAYASDAIDDSGAHDFAVKVAYKKVGQKWVQILLKGIGANLMVCLSVWQATCAEEVAGKVLALWFPVTGFVLMGFDHCIANQFLIPLGMMLGADISVYTLLFEALLPATIGNAIGGGICCGAVYWYVFDSMNTTKSFMQRLGTRGPQSQMTHERRTSSTTEGLRSRSRRTQTEGEGQDQNTVPKTANGKKDKTLEIAASS